MGTFTLLALYIDDHYIGNKQLLCCMHSKLNNMCYSQSTLPVGMRSIEIMTKRKLMGSTKYALCE